MCNGNDQFVFGIKTANVAGWVSFGKAKVLRLFQGTIIIEAFNKANAGKLPPLSDKIGK